jgi:hypothetical protein
MQYTMIIKLPKIDYIEVDTEWIITNLKHADFSDETQTMKLFKFLLNYYCLSTTGARYDETTH